MDVDLNRLLSAQAPDAPIEWNGETAYLRLGNGGAELGVHLINSHTPMQIEEAMKRGFQSATEFDAGLACTLDGNTLVLSRWLPDVGTWAGAAPFLEQLLEQLEAWRAMLAPQVERRVENSVSARTEQRLRALLAGGKA